jgi:hypothetical protein
MESLVQGKLARRVRWGGCRNVRSERNEARCVLTQSMRERLATLTRKCRHATAQLSALQTGMYLLGTTYNFCWPHQELSCVREHSTGKRHHVRACTPAMAAQLTDHIWSVCELLSYKVVPPPWVAPKRRGRPRTRPLPNPTQLKRPRGRPRKQVPCATTS